VGDNGDGTYAVLYIDGDEWDSCPAGKLEKIPQVNSDDDTNGAFVSYSWRVSTNPRATAPNRIVFTQVWSGTSRGGAVEVWQ
jgi:hypothetical protein